MRTKNLIKNIISHSKKEIDTNDWKEKISDIYIPTGSTILNLALSDKIEGGFNAGKIVNLIGDSSSGKTFIALSCLAELSHSRKFEKYRLIYDDVEQANKFNIKHLFGEKTDKRIKKPIKDYSNFIEDFRDNIIEEFKNKEPFVYVLDSFDALTSEEEMKKVEEHKKAREKGTKISGTYGMEKAKSISQILRMIKANLCKTNSLLIIVSQTRDNIGLSFAEKTRSGGRALKFYSTHEIWTAHSGFIKKKINDKDRKIGIKTKIKITKNKLTGKINEIEIPIFYDYGIDDIRGNIEWLIEENVWSSRVGFIISDDDNDFPKLTLEKLILHIEKNNLEEKLKEKVGKNWNDIQEKLKLNHRKRKYE